MPVVLLQWVAIFYFRTKRRKQRGKTTARPLEVYSSGNRGIIRQDASKRCFPLPTDFRSLDGKELKVNNDSTPSVKD
jgi:hypothetical protein